MQCASSRSEVLVKTWISVKYVYGKLALVHFLNNYKLQSINRKKNVIILLLVLEYCKSFLKSI